MGPTANSLLETDLIHTFVAISEAGNFTAAAKRVLRTPSAVSMQMKRLEEQLGRPLFHRHGRHVSLTVDGEALLIHSRELLRINEEALARFRVAQLEGRIRFGALDDFGARFLPEILARFASTHPLVEVDVVLSTTAALTKKLEAGDVDLILTAARAEESLPGESIYREALVWVGKRKGTAHKRTPIPLTLSAQGCPWRAAALKSVEGQKLRYRIAYTCETGQGQLAAVHSDLAIAPIPASLVTDDHEVLGLKQGLSQIGEYQLLLCEGNKIGPAGRAFATHVISSFRAVTAMAS